MAMVQLLVFPNFMPGMSPDDIGCMSLLPELDFADYVLLCMSDVVHARMEMLHKYVQRNVTSCMGWLWDQCLLSGVLLSPHDLSCAPQVVFDLEWRAADSREAAQDGGTSSGHQADEDEVMLPADAPIPSHVVNAPIAARALASDGVIAVPTDTLYGAQICLLRVKEIQEDPFFSEFWKPHPGRCR